MMFKVAAVKQREGLHTKIPIYHPLYKHIIGKEIEIPLTQLSGSKHTLLIDSMERLLEYLKICAPLKTAKPKTVALENITFSNKTDIDTFLTFLSKIPSIETVHIAIPSQKVFDTDELELYFFEQNKLPRLQFIEDDNFWESSRYAPHNAEARVVDYDDNLFKLLPCVVVIFALFNIFGLNDSSLQTNPWRVNNKSTAFLSE